MGGQYFWLWASIAIAGSAHAQWLHHLDPTIPRTRSRQPNLAAPTPRVNGKPDFSGIWEAESSPIPELLRLLPGGGNGLGEDTPNKYFISVLADFKAGEEPLQPTVIRQGNAIRTFRKDDPGFNCLPRGLPLLDLQPAPFKIIQTPREIIVLYETETTFRQIFTDGRKLPRDAAPSWMGYSVGQWDSDHLVVDTIGLNDRGWLDASGDTHSDALRIHQRFHRRDVGHIDVEMTLEDPKTFTKPVTFTYGLRLLPDTDLIENYCSEGERDLTHVRGN